MSYKQIEYNAQPEESKALSFRGVLVSSGVLERRDVACCPKPSNEDLDKLTVRENAWVEKLEQLDQQHTRECGLTIKEAQPIFDKLEKWTKSGKGPACPDKSKAVFKCLEKNRGEALKCSEQVESFVNCVDSALRKAAQSDYSKQSKKLSYTEKFERLVV
ncbi:hypothetical protein TKK_0002072 [Trichogramma kaykai]|uniref:MICOS complex subunit MIC19 n=1 Tax=Trichogramma kaykai TaxID=54128 RepID=A0ABD2X8K0_9HYME